MDNEIVIRDKFATVQSYSDLPKRLIISSPFRHNSVTSYGIILYALDTNRWHLVQRNHSPEYIELIRGSYRHSRISILLTGLSRRETTKLKSLTIGPDQDFLDEYDRVVPTHERDLALAKFNDCRQILIDELRGFDAFYEETEWLWPKGRPINAESPFRTAVREFEEETSIPYDLITLVSPKIVKEYYIGRNERKYQTKCWIFTIDRETDVTQTELTKPTEIGRRGWFSYEEAMKRLRESKREALIRAAEIIKNSLMH